uniref:Selenoprotein O n=1 Tax=Eucampia antarctica TaxID=49252 RepID=A0A7S2S7N9_9STRA|mmetsp:Transcript_3959/g.3724  ORF Transcript_3959/g.3724 Transcript_3959/m.3724 type:complete len:419 (+) Transcript_3959:68-1324(+)
MLRRAVSELSNLRRSGCLSRHCRSGCYIDRYNQASSSNISSSRSVPRLCISSSTYDSNNSPSDVTEKSFMTHSLQPAVIHKFLIPSSHNYANPNNKNNCVAMLGDTIERKKKRRKVKKSNTTTTTFATLLLLALSSQNKNNNHNQIFCSSFYTSAFSLNMSSTKSANKLSSTASSDESTTSSTDDTNRHPLASLREKLNNSWISQLQTETSENRQQSLQRANLDVSHTLNNIKRPIFNGHYIKVEPTPLKEPRLVIHSPQMVQQLGLSSEDIQADAFVQYVSANLDGSLHNDEKSDAWATPYALSIMGTRYTSNCPFGTGDGYGDGRALSIGEFLINDSTNERLELQLKGAGPTPFCRGADGRAVFRSSIREFLASEAMHHLGVSTTRALSLVVSPIDTSRRPWYSPQNTKKNTRCHE